MRAVVVERWVPPSELVVSEAPEPVLEPGSVVLDVKAAGCNFFDILMVEGKYQAKPPFPFIPGAEVAGVVAAVGPEVAGVTPGDRVYAGVSIGAFAERIAVPAAALHPVPEGMTFEQAAALPVVYPTSYAGLVYRAALQPGENLLVHAAAGGVGLAAVQIGKALGARVIATAGDPEKRATALREGADVAIDYTSEGWVDRVREETGGRGADVIYDPVGGEVFDRSLRCVAWNGRVLVVGFASGVTPEVRVNRILLKNIAVVGLHWGAYAANEPERVGETFEALERLHRTGGIRPVVFDTHPLERVSEALEALGSRRTWGKVILTP
jgi:NADPH2:quinone reductase